MADRCAQFRARVAAVQERIADLEGSGQPGALGQAQRDLIRAKEDLARCERDRCAQFRSRVAAVQERIADLKGDMEGAKGAVVQGLARNLAKAQRDLIRAKEALAQCEQTPPVP